MTYWLYIALFIIVVIVLLIFFEQYYRSTVKDTGNNGLFAEEATDCEGEDCIVIDDPLPEAKPSPNPIIQGNLICYITEYDQPPDDTQGPPSQDELEQINNAKNEDSELEESFEEDNSDNEESFEEDNSDNEESFRGGRRDGGGRGGRHGGGGRGGRRGGGGRRDGRRRGGGRRGGGGRGFGGRRGRGGGMIWPWRTWPRRNWGRPWRSYSWRSYPNYIYTYPSSYYDSDWEAPIQRFTIRLGPKGDRHPFADQGSDLGYMITTGTATGCGTSGALLSLQRGRTYEFDIYTSVDCVTGQPRNEPFFFTTDKEGGSQAGEIFNITPTHNGTIRITITENLPNQFYYQSTNNPYVGGHVILHS